MVLILFLDICTKPRRTRHTYRISSSAGQIHHIVFSVVHEKFLWSALPPQDFSPYPEIIAMFAFFLFLHILHSTRFEYPRNGLMLTTHPRLDRQPKLSRKYSE